MINAGGLVCRQQRWAIARVLLRHAPMVLDDAPANLDSTAAAHLAQLINRLLAKATLIFIAHHIPENLKVDRVLK